jgi:hypothetical protein
MAVKLIGTKIIPLTPDIALEFATMPTFKGERALRPGLIKHLESRISEGLFHSPKWAFAWMRGVKYRMNGQHSSNVLCNANGDFPKDLDVIVDEFVCDTEEDLAVLFEQFDNKRSSRTEADIFGAHGRVALGDLEIANSEIRDVVNGIAYHLHLRAIESAAQGFHERVDVDRMSLIAKYREFFEWRKSIGTTKARAKNMARKALGAAVFATWTHNKEAATDFWSQLMSESNPDVDHPTRVLGRFIRDEVIGHRRGGGGNKNSREVWDDRSVYCKCLNAYIAYREGRPTGLRYFASAPLPKL